MGWAQLHAGITLPIDPSITVPPLTLVELPAPVRTAVADVESAARDEVVERFAGAVTDGMTVAVGAGSRGLTARVELLRGAIAGLRDLGAAPFVVPAMGSHGGATAEGQLATLAKLGMTADALDAEIRSSMETVVVAHDASGRPLHLDVHAAGADRILPVNRMKPHTAFRGPIESGCTKMIVVGFGKQPGAAQFHSSGAAVMRDQLLEGVDAIRDSGRILGGVASIEAPSGDVVTVRALTADEVGGPAEVALTDESRDLVAALPFPEIDVLVIEEGGKDISGTTIDPNVTGRFWVNGLADLPAPKVAMIVLLGLTPVTAGNATGIGFVDFVPVALAEQIDWEATYVNSFTAGGSGVRRGRMPMVLPDEESCIRAALQTCGRPFDAPKRVVRIHSTLHLTHCSISDALLADLPDGVAIAARDVLVAVRPCPDTFFTSERRADGSEWFLPTDHARGPWDPDACHGGPPTGLLVRALEQALPRLRLARISVDLGRPVPMAGFTIVTEVTRAGRATANTAARLLDADGKVRATATGMHLAVAPTPIFEARIDNSGTVTPRLADSSPGEFPVGRVAHGQPGFRGAVEIRYPEGEDNTPGATAVWMRTVALLPDEEMSPFQRISPLADCGNAFGRNAEPDRGAVRQHRSA